MNRLSKCVLAAFAFLLLGFSATPCRAQNEGQLLHAGLLGYTGGGEDEALLLSPAAIGQVFSGPTREALLSGNRPSSSSSLSLRIGSFRHNHNGLDRTYGSVPFFGIGVTRSLSDLFSTRFSVDFGIGSGWNDQDLLLMPIKASVLFGPSMAASSQGYFKPYLGMGVEADYINESSWEGDFSEWGFGFHFLVGADYVFNGFSLGLELDWSDVDVSSTELDGGGLSFLLNIGIHF